MDLPKSDKSLNEQDELRRLREENARLKELLTRHGIAWEESTSTAPIPAPTESAPAPVPNRFTTDDKIALFRRLFRGREDVYPQRWESAKGTSGYSPAYGNEWKPSVCHKPRVKCGDCNQRQLLPVTDQVIYDKWLDAALVSDGVPADLGGASLAVASSLLPTANSGRRSSASPSIGRNGDCEYCKVSF